VTPTFIALLAFLSASTRLSHGAMEMDIPPGAIRHHSPLAAEVALVLSSDKAIYVPGEGILFTLEARSVVDFPIRAGLMLDPRFGNAVLLWRKGAAGTFAEVPLMERREEIGTGPLRPLEPGAARRFSFKVAIGDKFSLPYRAILEDPGTYEFKVNYADTAQDPNGLLESNNLGFTVVAATGDDLRALVALTPEIRCFLESPIGCFVPPTAVMSADQFLRAHGSSIYAATIRYGLRGFLGPRIRTRQATNEEVSVWERHFAGGNVAPPTLSLSPTPATLWPPNRQLTPVFVNITATDDSGIPAVVLISIACDDSCDPVRDIAEAAFGTDDRTFKLRADRTGGGKGRTYTIVYEATNAAGRKTRATTIVTVPHDRGKN